MTIENNNICPCCGKGCDLANPRCSRGEEYARTGVIPPKKERHHDGNYPRKEDSTAEKIATLLRRLGHRYHHAFGGRSSQNRVLALLAQPGHMTQRELTEALGIQPGSASELLQKLEKKGWICRTPNEKDHRTTDVSLTDAGLAEVRQAHTRAPEDLLAELTSEEQEQLLYLLEKLAGSQVWGGERKGHHHCHRER